MSAAGRAELGDKGKEKNSTSFFSSRCFAGVSEFEKTNTHTKSFGRSTLRQRFLKKYGLACVGLGNRVRVCVHVCMRVNLQDAFNAMHS